MAARSRAHASAATRRINAERGAPSAVVWQRNYFEHIIRDETALNRIREYIIANPLRWTLDRENHTTAAPLIEEDDYRRITGGQT